MSEQLKKSSSSAGDLLTLSPILRFLFILSVLNWFMFFCTSLYFHGDALNILPSIDGFVVTSHGHRSPVSESVWVFSLFYSGITILITPAIWIAVGWRLFGNQPRNRKRLRRLFVYGFIGLWCLFWYSSIGNSMRLSIESWQQLRQTHDRSR